MGAWETIVSHHITFQAEKQMLDTETEESKVNGEEPKISSGSLNKRGATRVARFWHWVFKEQACPHSGEGSLLRWFWSFTGLSQAVAD